MFKHTDFAPVEAAVKAAMMKEITIDWDVIEPLVEWFNGEVKRLLHEKETFGGIELNPDWIVDHREELALAVMLGVDTLEINFQGPTLNLSELILADCFEPEDLPQYIGKLEKTLSILRAKLSANDQ